MNIIIPHSWLKTLLETKEHPRLLAEKLSLSGPSVEKIENRGEDFIYNIEVTTNRPDTFSVWGIAREIYSILRFHKIPVKLKSLVGTNILPKLETGELPLTVKIEKEGLCPRFSAIILDDVTVKPSPDWMQKHLELSGIRSLNNVVDISNYLMLELGQPMHTFDYDKIQSANMILRESKEAEEIVTLDGQIRKLPQGAIVIEDKGRLIDLCGIMGGENSQIEERTKRVLLFVQTYDPARIRKTTQEIGLRTDASTRFEKGLDTEGTAQALNRAVWLLKELSGAKVASKIIDIYPHPYSPKTVTLEKKKLDQYLGVNIPFLAAKNILETLGFEVSTTSSQIKATVPSFRALDIEIEEDLIEEVARIWGYDRLPSLLPAGEVKIGRSNIFYWEDRVKDYLKYQGFFEVYSYSMISRSDLEKVGLSENQALKIRNPLNLDQEYMRPTLLPSFLKIIASNQGRDDTFKFFELANRYEPSKNYKQPRELFSLAGISHNLSSQNDDFYVLKGTLEGLFDDLGVKANFNQKDIPNLVKGQTAIISAGEKEIGRIGKVDPKVAKAFGVEGNVHVFGLMFEELASLAKLTKKYSPISKYPKVVEDLSMIIDDHVEINNVLEVIRKSSGKLLKKVDVFDIFKDSKIGLHKKSVAVHLVYQSQNHNLEGKEVEEIRKKIIETLSIKLKARVRLKENALKN